MSDIKSKHSDQLQMAIHRLKNIDIDSLTDQKSIPSIAKNPSLMAEIRTALSDVETHHAIYHADARELGFLKRESIHLAITSPPYWTLKEYQENGRQLGHIEDYDEFVQELVYVWEEVFRVLVPGGRMVIVVGDVNVSRRSYGRHLVFPLHASIQESCRRIGFDNLAPIIWHKITNAKFEAGGGGFLGKPYEPNAIIKNDIEYILMQRKPGGYRKPTIPMRLFSTISAQEHKEWFQQIWRIPGASTKDHPAPFPVDLAERLIRMFSFVGDIVLDPFAGSGTTTIAASNSGRNSIGIEVEELYLKHAVRRVRHHLSDMFIRADLRVEL